jgi:hypothetical protein
MSGDYSVVVTGKIADGFSVEQVKTNVARLFKIEGEQVNKLISAKPVVVRRGIDKKQAVKIQQALAKAGAVAVIKVQRPPEEKAAATNTATPPVPPVVKAKPVANICCPRCGHEQVFSRACGHCKMDLTLHIGRMERKEKARVRREQLKNAG